MTMHRVAWYVDEEADSPEQAARQVAEKYFQERIAAGQTDSACVFEVGHSVKVDLAAPEGERVTPLLDETGAKYLAYANEYLANDDLEFNDNAVVSVATDGAFVACWKWVPAYLVGLDDEDEGEQ